MRGEGIVASINEIGFKDDNGNVAYPKFLMPERGMYLSPRAKRNQAGENCVLASRPHRSSAGLCAVRDGPRTAEHSAVTAYDRYQNTLYSGIGSTERQLSEIDHRFAAGESVIKYKYPLNVLNDTYDHICY